MRREDALAHVLIAEMQLVISFLFPQVFADLSVVINLFFYVPGPYWIGILSLPVHVELLSYKTVETQT